MYIDANYWLNQYPNENFIIWAANAHIIKKDDILKKEGSKHYLLGLKKLGDYLHESYSSVRYSVGVTSAKGATTDFLNINKMNTIGNPSYNSLEYFWIKITGSRAIGLVGCLKCEIWAICPTVKIYYEYGILIT